jgi:hypothetical protein
MFPTQRSQSMQRMGRWPDRLVECHAALSATVFGRLCLEFVVEQRQPWPRRIGRRGREWRVQFVGSSPDFRLPCMPISVPLLKERSSPLAGREFSGSLAKRRARLAPQDPPRLSDESSQVRWPRDEVGWEPRPSVASKPNDLAGKRRGFEALEKKKGEVAKPVRGQKA